jgi:imidazolonepropionase-like amidohydrolase
MRLGLAVLFTAALAACSHEPPPLIDRLDERKVTVFADVSLFSGAGTAAVPHQDVWVEGEIVSYVGDAGSRPVPTGAVVVKGAGRTLLPGLIDLHVHTANGAAPPWDFSLPDADRNLREYLYTGVTTIVDLGGPLAELAERRDELAAGKRIGPRMFMTGPHWTCVGGHPVAMLKDFLPWPLPWFLEDSLGYQIDGTAAVRDAFQDFLEAKPDFVKVTSDQIPLGIPTIHADVAAEVVARAHAAGKKTFGHIGDNADAQKLVRAGIDILAHGVYREPMSDETAALIAAKGVKVEPTLAVFDTIARLGGGEYVLSKLQLRIGDPDVARAILGGKGDYEIPERFKHYLEVTSSGRNYKFDNVRKLRQYGVTILVGSDSPGMGQFAGASLHDELDLLVQKAGLTPGEALHAATYENAVAIAQEHEIGTVTVGKRADLLLVRGDPVADIAAVHEIDDVYQAGRRVARFVP